MNEKPEPAQIDASSQSGLVDGSRFFPLTRNRLSQILRRRANFHGDRRKPVLIGFSI
jgi:hypothetical protein